MKKITLNDIQEGYRFQPLTQGEDATIQLLIDKCNEYQSQVEGFIEARREILHNSFDRDTAKDIFNLLPQYSASNVLLNQMMVVMFEKVTRDLVREYMIVDMVDCYKQRLSACEGDVEKAVDQLEKYFTCGKLVPFAQTWKEACEEIEEGKVIYYEPNTSRSL